MTFDAWPVFYISYKDFLEGERGGWWKGVNCWVYGKWESKENYKSEIWTWVPALNFRLGSFSIVFVFDSSFPLKNVLNFKTRCMRITWIFRFTNRCNPSLMGNPLFNWSPNWPMFTENQNPPLFCEFLYQAHTKYIVVLWFYL